MINEKYNEYIEYFENSNEISSPIIFYKHYLDSFVSSCDVFTILLSFYSVQTDLKDLLANCDTYKCHNIDFTYYHTFNKIFTNYFIAPNFSTAFLQKNTNKMIRQTYKQIICILLEDIEECLKYLNDRYVTLTEKEFT